MSRLKTGNARMARMEESARARGLVDRRTSAEREQEQWLQSLSDLELDQLERALIEDDKPAQALFATQLRSWLDGQA